MILFDVFYWSVNLVFAVVSGFGIYFVPGDGQCLILMAIFWFGGAVATVYEVAFGDCDDV